MTVESEIIRVTLDYLSPGASAQQNVFVFQFQGTTSEDDVTLDAIEDWFVNVWHPAWADLASAESQMEAFKADVIGSDGVILRTLGGAPLGLPGAAIGDVTTAAVSGYIMAYTELPKQRGSKYIPGVGETQTNDGLITPEGLADLAVLLAIFLGDVPVEAGSILRPGIWSRVLLAFQKFAGSGLIEARPAYQRRRKQGVGI